MSISDKFQSFLSKLRTKNHIVITDRYKKITKRLNKDFWGIDSDTKNSRYVGSYGRGTSINGFSDVDVMMILPTSTFNQYNNYSDNGQSSLLQAVKNSIGITYPLTTKIGDGQVVVVTFTDKTKFEIVPSFYNVNQKYYYPDSNNGGKWKEMNPIAEINAINDINSTYNKKVKHLVRMMKAWKNHNSVPITGFLIETLAIQFMEQWEYNDKSFFYYDYMVRDFLEFLSTRNSEQTYWLARGSGQYVYRTGAFEHKAKQSFNAAKTATNYEAEKKSSLADLYWNDIFGEYF